jgi:hypothetical protein
MDISDILKQKTIEIKNIKTQLARAEDDRLNWENALAIYQHYSEAGTIKKYHITPESLYNLVKWGKQYKYLAPHYNFDTFKPHHLQQMWLSAESGFDISPTCIYVNPSGQRDYYAYQLGDMWLFEPIPSKNLWRIADRLFPYLADRPDSDPEKNTVVWYLWLDRQSEKTNNGVWQLWNKWLKGIPGKLKPRLDVIALYDKIKRVK